MAPNNRLISTIVFFILSAIAVEAQNASPPPAVDKPIVRVVSTPSVNAPETSECDKYIEEHMQTTANKTKEFLLKEILERLNDRSTGDAERKCLMSCFQAYQTALDSITKGINDISQSKYGDAVQNVVEYSKAIAPCMQCSAAETALKGAKFIEFQKWAKNSADDLHGKLNTCK